MSAGEVGRDVFLAQAAERIVRHLDLASRLQAAAEAAVPTLADQCIVTLVNMDGSIRRSHIVARDAASTQRLRDLDRDYPPIKGERTPVSQVLSTGAPVLLPRIDASMIRSVARDETHARKLEELQFRSACLLPLRARRSVIGVLALSRSGDSPPQTEDDLAFASHYAQLVGILLENGGIYDEQNAALQRQISLRDRLLLLGEATSSLLAAPSLEAALDGILGLAPRLVSADAYALWGHDRATGRWDLLASRGLSAQFRRDAASRTAPGAPPPGGPMIVEHVEGDPQLGDLAHAHVAEGIRSLLALPLGTPDGGVGTLTLYYRAHRTFNEVDLVIAKALASIAASVIVNARVHRERDEKAQEAEEGRARRGAMLDASIDAIITIDHQGRVVEWNRASETIFGYSRAEAIGRPMDALIVPDSHAASHRRGMEHHHRTGEAPVLGKRLQLPAKRRDGTLFPIELTITRVPRDGPPLFTGFVRDLTEQRRVEEALAQSERRMHASFENAPIGMVLTSLDGRFMQVNAAFARMLDRRPADLEGRPIEEVTHPEEVGATRDLVHRLVRGEHSVGQIKKRYLRRDGATVEAEVVVGVVRDASGSPLHFLTHVRDVSEKREVESQLEAARRRASTAEKMAALGSLVSGVAHELRTPLAYLANNTELIRRTIARAGSAGQLPHETVAALEGFAAESTEAVDRIRRLVKDLRKFHTVAPAPRTPRSLHEPVRDALRLFQATHRDATIDAQLQPTLLIPLDGAAIQQIVLNLLENAHDATGTSGRPISIRTLADDDGGILVVSDQGAGIAADALPRIYDPLYTTKRTGSGLGLSIVKRIVDEHAAQISCQSAPGVGTTFTLRFPLHPPAPPA